MRKRIGVTVKAFTVPGYAVKSALVAACVLLLGAGLARATTVMIPTDDDMIVGADPRLAKTSGGEQRAHVSPVPDATF